MKTIRDFAPANRYVYDFGVCSINKGFAQVDTSQDASYYGTWANPVKLCVLTYCEGDVTLRQAESSQEFVLELRDIKAWNQENGHQFLGIDPGFDEALKNQFISLGLSDLLH